MTINLTIDSNPIGSFFELKVRRMISRKSSDISIRLIDPDNEIWPLISYGADITLTVDGENVFRGRVENYAKNYDTIEIYGRDYWSLTLLRPITRVDSNAYTNKTAEYIIKDLLTLYFPELSNAGVQATTKTYNRTFIRRSFADIVKEFCDLEGFQAYIDSSLTFHFEPEGFIDNGKVFDYTSGAGKMLSYSFKRIGKKLKNVIYVYGEAGGVAGSGIAVRKTNPASVAKYGEQIAVVVDSSIKSEEEALERAEFELARWSSPLQTGEITILLDPSVQAGEIVYLTIPEFAYENRPFLVVEIEMDIIKREAKIFLADIQLDLSDVLTTYLKKLDRHETFLFDSSINPSYYERFTENITVRATYEIYKIQSTVADFNIASFDVDVFGPEEIEGELIGSGTMVITKNGLNLIRDWLAGDSVSAPAGIAVGIGTTPPTTNDTAMKTETSREAFDTGYPDKPSDYVVRYQRDISTSEENGNSLSEIGLFNNAVSGGTLICRQTFNPITKDSSFSLKMRIDIEVNSA